MADADESRDIPGFTERQKQWFRQRDGSRCSMFVCIGGEWHRCPNSDYLHVHHVTPRGWYAQHSSKTWDVNDKTNGIVLCNSHHVGKYADFSDRFVIHPDMRDFFHRYRRDDIAGYDYVRNRREELASRGIPYWNTVHDWLFYRLVQHRNRYFEKEYPAREDPWYVNELADSQLFKDRTGD